jgi:transposase-like protein
MKVYCCNDEREAVCFTGDSTPLCLTCRNAFQAGQQAPEAEIVSLEDVDVSSGPHYCTFCDQSAALLVTHGEEVTFLCRGCQDNFEMGQTSPSSTVRNLDDVIFTCGGRHYTITRFYDAATGEWKTP